MPGRPRIGGRDMARPSRRAIIAAGIALSGSRTAQALTLRPALQALNPDPLVTCARAWIALRMHVDALSADADDLQGQVFDKARLLGIRGDKACRSSMPEARAWRAKHREHDKARRLLEKRAEEIRKMRASTIGGAIAKIELSLHIQYEDWSDHAFEFIEDGVAELRELTANATEYR